MTVELIADRLSSKYGSDKFIGYIASKDEYVIATHFKPHGYGWSQYFQTSAELIEYIAEDKNDKDTAYEVLNYISQREV